MLKGKKSSSAAPGSRRDAKENNEHQVHVFNARGGQVAQPHVHVETLGLPFFVWAFYPFHPFLFDLPCFV